MALPPACSVECCFYQSRASSAAKQLELTTRGIELRSLQGSAAPTTVRDKSADVIDWCDVLGAAALSPETLAHVPNYRPRNAPTDLRTDFVVFGCIPKSRAIKKSVLASGLQLLACFTGGGSSADATADDATAAAAAAAASTASSSDKKRKRSSAPPIGACDRVLVQWVFRYTGSVADAATAVPQLVAAIQRRADPRTATVLASGDNESESSVAMPQRRFLVLVNPVGGTGRAQQLYEATAAPLLQQSNVTCEVVVTQYQHHATELAAALPLGTYDCVVAVGGDGLLSEVVQGLMRRSDWADAIKQPLGILPAGSGNGLSATLLHRSGESFDLLNAAFALAKGVSHDLDIASVVNSASDSVMYAFLSLSWAFMADVDIDSERYRLFGGLRFTMSAVAKLLSKHTDYTGRVRYLSASDAAAPPPKYHDETHANGSLRPALECLSTADSSDTSDREDPVAAGWKELTGPFHMFWGVNVSHTGAQGHLAPAARIDDGYFHLLVVAGEYSRINMTRMLLGLEDGSHVGKPQVELIRTRAFTLSADNAADRLCVDGELFSGPQLKMLTSRAAVAMDNQVEVHRALGRVVCLPPLTQC